MTNSILLISLLAISLLTFVSPAGAQDLPTAEKVLDRYVEVSGGKAAYDRIKNRVTTASVYPASGQQRIQLKIYAAKPNKHYSKLWIEGVPGTMEKGANGEIAWERSPVATDPILKGGMRGMRLRETVFNRIVNWRQVWGKVECSKVTAVAGQACYELVMTPKPFDEAEKKKGNEPTPDRLYFSKTTGFLVMGATTVPGEAGPVELQIFQSSYKKIDGVFLPFRIERAVKGQPKTVTKIESIVQNVELEESTFALPPDIQRLIDARKKEDG